MTEPRIPNPVAAVVGEVLGSHYYSHRRINVLFMEKGAPGDPPVGNCVDKCTAWLKRASNDPDTDALGLLGGVLEDFMEVDPFPSDEFRENGRRRIRDIMGRYGMSYHPGGRILGVKSGFPAKALDTILRTGDLPALEVEFSRSLANLETDPGAAITAASAIVEALCKVVIEDDGLPLPSDQSVSPLWKVVAKHLNFDPADVADDDLKRILSGLSSIVHGLGALRTHVGSAHGHGRHAYRPAPRHARLAIHSAHTLTVFTLETWRTRKDKPESTQPPTPQS